MKQKLEKIVKNRWVWAGVGVVILGVFSAFWLDTTNERIFDYVPQNVDQAFVIRVNSDNTLLSKNYLQTLPGNIETLFADINIVVITQKTIDAVTENLIFVQTKPGFKPQDLADSMNGSGEVEYLYQTLENNLYVFGKPDSLKFVKLDSKNNLFAVEKLKSFDSLLRSAEISFFSRVSANPELVPAVSNIDYLVYGVDIQGEKMDLQAHLVYKEKRELDASYRFKPFFRDYVNDKNLVFLELGNVIQQLGIDKETILANLQALLPVWGVKDLTVQDYETIYSALSNNVGLVVGEGNNFIGAGLALLFRNPTSTESGQGFFGVLSKMIPAAYDLVSAFSFLSGVQPVYDPAKQGFTAQVMGVQDIGLYVEKKGEDTLLTLGDPDIQAEGNLDVDYSSQTIGYFKVNFTPVLDLYKRFKSSLAQLSPLGQVAGEEDFSFFEGKSLAGQIVASEEGVSIKAALE